MIRDGATLYLKLKAGAVASVAVLVGDPARVNLFRARLDGAATVAQGREFATVTGRFEGIPVSVVSCGIGAPAAAIVVEELAAMGTTALIRAGTMMTLRASIGGFILAEAARRGESTSETYAAPEVEAVAHPDLLAALRAALEESRRPFTSGLVGTLDGFYTQMMPLRGTKLSPQMEQFWADGVLGVDMETSAIYAVARTLGLKAVSCCAGTVEAGSGRMLDGPDRRGLEEALVDIVLRGVRLLAERGHLLPASAK